MGVKTIMTVTGCFDGTTNIGRDIIADAFNKYSTVSSYFGTIRNPYQVYPHIMEMEKEGLNYAAALVKLGICHEDYAKLNEIRKATDVLVLTNYIDDIVMTFILKELTNVKTKEETPDMDVIIKEAASLVEIAYIRFGMLPPSVSIPANPSDDPEKVVYPPIVLDAYQQAVSQIVLYEHSDYLFPSDAIQVIAYYAFGLYNRFCNMIRSSNEINFYSLDGTQIPSNSFGLTSSDTMSFFEGFLKDDSRKFNYNGKALVDPMKDLVDPNANTIIPTGVRLEDLIQNPPEDANNTPQEVEEANPSDEDTEGEETIDGIDLNGDSDQTLVNDIPDIPDISEDIPVDDTPDVSEKG